MENKVDDYRANEFKDEWEKYLQNLKIVLLRKLETRRKSRREKFQPLVKNTFSLLLEDRALRNVATAAKHIELPVLDLYQEELKIFNSSIEDNDYDLDEAVDDGEQAKGSAEKIFTKLPKWLRDALKILNEIIKMLQGG